MGTRDTFLQRIDSEVDTLERRIVVVRRQAEEEQAQMRQRLVLLRQTREKVDKTLGDTIDALAAAGVAKVI